MMNLAGTSLAVPGPPCVIATTASNTLTTITNSSTNAVETDGPSIGSEVPAKFIMDYLFGRANIGLASAASIVLLATVLAIVAPLYFARNRRSGRVA